MYFWYQFWTPISIRVIEFLFEECSSWQVMKCDIITCNFCPCASSVILLKLHWNPETLHKAIEGYRRRNLNSPYKNFSFRLDTLYVWKVFCLVSNSAVSGWVIDKTLYKLQLQRCIYEVTLYTTLCTTLLHKHINGSTRTVFLIVT